MQDNRGRDINYLRISVTDRCNLRCVYCMGEYRENEIRHPDILTYEEILRIVKIFLSLGIENIKITGGEPLVRKGVIELIKNIKSLSGVKTLTITTNGLLLSDYIKQLSDAKVDAINISLDSLDREDYKNITKIDAIDKVVLGIKEALKYTSIKIKINSVLNCCSDSMKNIIDITSLAKDNNIDVRFIELMPISFAQNYKSKNEIDILNILKSEYGNYTTDNKKLGNGPARYYSFESLKGHVGFITALTHSFCDTCNRVRLTSVGYLKTCLDSNDGLDLKALIRTYKVDDETIKNRIIETIKEKPQGHNFNSGNIENKNSMNKIGG